MDVHLQPPMTNQNISWKTLFNGASLHLTAGFLGEHSVLLSKLLEPCSPDPPEWQSEERVNACDSCQMWLNSLLLTHAPVNHQAGLCRTWGATEVEHKAKAVFIPPWVKDRAVELCLVLSLRQPVEGQRRGCGLLWSKSHQRRSTCSHPRGNGRASSSTCILVEQHFPIDVSAGRSDQFDSHGALTATPVSVAVLHQQLVGEDTGQVESSRAGYLLRRLRGAQGHTYEVPLCEGKGAGQLHTLVAERFDRVSCARSDFVDVVPADLVVLHVADLEEESRVKASGASVEAFISGYSNLGGNRRGDMC